MSVYSMTGFASVQKTTSDNDLAPSPGAWTVELELRSVNSRFLDLSLRIPDELRGHEGLLRERLTQRLTRGKVELRIALQREDGSTLTEPAPRQLQRLASVQDQVLAWLPQARPLGVADVLRLTGGGAPLPSEALQTLLPALVDDAIEALLAARAREGERLAQALRERVAALRALAEQAAPLIPELVAQQRERFLSRWSEALHAAGAAPESAQDRALAEATAFALRIDVAEELTRLASHLSEIDALLARGGVIGKRLDFLIQELHREANTLGSKSAALDLTRISIDMKVLIEQMREQVQNLE